MRRARAAAKPALCCATLKQTTTTKKRKPAALDSVLRTRHDKRDCHGEPCFPLSSVANKKVKPKNKSRVTSDENLKGGGETKNSGDRRHEGSKVKLANRC